MNNSNTDSISREVKKLRSYTYSSLCQYLKNKYGEIKEPYFINDNCKTKNEKIKRTNDGLFIHHIYENKAVMLSHPEYAIHFPFEWQEGKNLVYCNYFEHILLHVAIVKEFIKEEAKKTKTAVGIGGLLNYMFPEIIDYINGYDYAREYMKKALSVIDGNELLFIDILKDLEGYILHDHDVFSIVYATLGKSRRRVMDAFENGKMTRSGKFNDWLFTYEVYKKHIKLVNSNYFYSVMGSALDKSGYDYSFDVRPHGKYYYIGFSYRNKSGSLVFREYAVSSSDQIDIDYLKRKHFRTIATSDKTTCLIKKDSVVSCKENKKSKNVNKRYCLAIDGAVVDCYSYTKEQALKLVEMNKE